MRTNNELSSDLNVPLTPEWPSLTARARGSTLMSPAIKCEALNEKNSRNYRSFELTFKDGSHTKLHMGVMNSNPSSWLIWMGDLPRSHDLFNSVVSNSTQLTQVSGHWIISSEMGVIQLSTSADSLTICDTLGNSIYRSCPSDLLVGDVPVSFPFFKHSDGFGMSLDGGSLKHVVGGGEQFGQLNLVGRVYDVMNSDALGVNGHFRYQSTPFFVSNEGHSIAMLQCEPGRIDFGCRRHDIFTFTSDGPTLGLYLANKSSPIDAIEQWRALMGGVSSVPRWSFGLWLSRCFYKDEKELREVIENNSKYKTQASVINLDARAWMRAQTRTDFVWDTSRWSSFETFIPWLREKGFSVCLWENPYVSSATETLFAEGKVRGYFAKTAEGTVYPYQWVPSGLAGFPQPPLAGLVDFTNHEARNWWKDLHRPYLRAGVSCFKTDFGEEIPADAHFSDGSTGKELRNVYSDLYNLTVMEVMREECGENGIVWARSGFTKMGKTPVKWAGDSQTTWSALRATLRGGLSQAAGGAVFWSHDIGGFYGTAPSSELYLRWAQLGLWCSHARMHGTTAREPWEFGAETLEQVKADIARRERLLEYFDSAAQICTHTQQSFVSPLWLYHPEDPHSWVVDDQFFSGTKDVMIAPFLHETGGRKIYLPQGEWLFLNTGEVHQGCSHLSVNRLKTCPVFVRAHSRWKELFANSF